MAAPHHKGTTQRYPLQQTYRQGHSLDISPPHPITLEYRYRKLPDITSRDRSRVGHGARAAINTPIQGGAADVVMVAMIKIARSPLLKKIGWKLLLQVGERSGCIMI